MNYLRGLILPLIVALPLLAFAGTPSADEAITKARAYVGKERDINGLRSIHYLAHMEVRDSTGALVKTASGPMELILQKPDQQLVVRTLGQLRDTVGLDGLTGWQRTESVGEPKKGRTTILPRAQLRQTQANAFENLSFFRGLEQRGGRVEMRGETTIEGRPAIRIAFIHPGELVFLRSFDRETGRLLLSEGQDGERSREEGECVVQGIRFPKRVISTGRSVDGKMMVTTLFFDEIKVNEVFPPSTFAVPMVSPH
jgi:hypothetical protein